MLREDGGDTISGSFSVHCDDDLNFAFLPRIDCPRNGLRIARSCVESSNLVSVIPGTRRLRRGFDEPAIVGCLGCGPGQGL